MQVLSKLHSLSDIHSSGTSSWALFGSFDSLSEEMWRRTETASWQYFFGDA